MPNEITWLVYPRIILITLCDPFNLDDLLEVGASFEALLAEVEDGAKVYAITDATHLHTLSLNPIVISYHVPPQNISRIQQHVYVGDPKNALLNFAARFLLKLLFKDVQMTNSVADALAYLQKKDVALQLT